MKFVIFGGTTEGRQLAQAFAGAGAEVLVSVATEYGREKQGSCPGMTVVSGRRGVSEMAGLLDGASLCIDATHPYAAEATRTIRAACEQTGTAYLRMKRPLSNIPEDAVRMASAQDAGEWLAGTDGRILLTTGTKELSAFSHIPADRLVVRILPGTENIRLAEQAGILHKNIIAMEGPFSEELNAALIRQFRIAWLVTKDGGAAGGFPEKAEAARKTGIGLVVLQSPDDGDGEPYEQVLRDGMEMLK